MKSYIYLCMKIDTTKERLYLLRRWVTLYIVFWSINGRGLVTLRSPALGNL